MVATKYRGLIVLLTLVSACAEVEDPNAAGGTGGNNMGTGGNAGDGGGSGAGGNVAGDCAGEAVCVPAVPSGWSGPVSFGAGATAPSACPSEFPDEERLAFEGLVAQDAVCSCGCSVASATCNLISENTGGIFTPTQSCDDPPSENDCLSASLITSCNAIPGETVPPFTWGTEARICEGAAAGEVCTDGTCYPDPSSFGPVCILQEGEQTCPAGFPERELFFLDASDTRACEVCTCDTTGGACEIDIEVCSVAFFNLTLRSGEMCTDLPPPGEGDGVSLLNQTITMQPTCTTAGGTPTGEATPTFPITLCCLP
ncbi:MAG: hypothetical protein AAF436_22060 [Myxococcota bacterium]